METDSDPVDHRGVKAWGGGAGSLQRLKARGWQRDEGPAQSDCPVLTARSVESVSRSVVSYSLQPHGL